MNGKEICQELEGRVKFIRLGAEAGKTEDLNLPRSLMLMLDNIRIEWASSGSDQLKQLLDYVYETAPMVVVKDIHKQEKIKLNLPKEREKLIEELAL
ncbi:hypothetical protein [Okeania sp.]|uniref:hypothetical protein n=1 Tax=Okeania sp. TaxID=3100323 RepID=UPI002B4ABCCD|nr:hypothetical protein [Okeania sp.]MEB3339698.1 hypothetical protein [Okeania sp.]